MVKSKRQPLFLRYGKYCAGKVNKHKTPSEKKASFLWVSLSLLSTVLVFELADQTIPWHMVAGFKRNYPSQRNIATSYEQSFYFVLFR